MSNGPKVDGRKREALLEDLTELASSYVPEWTPAPGDPGTALLQIAAGLSEDVIERLDRVPHKHRVAFFDTLGFNQDPPQPARLPLTFDVTDGVDKNVVVPDGTQAVAEAKDNRPEQTFEIPPDGGFEATPANLTQVYSVDRDADRIVDHWTPLQAGNESRLFDGDNLQEHVFYIGHGDLLTLTAGSTIGLQFDPPETTETFCDHKRFTWQFYGEMVVEEEKKMGWHDLTEIPPSEPESDSEVRLKFPSGTTETELSGIKSRWIRCVVTKNDSSWTPFDIRIESIKLQADDSGLQPDKLLVNDVPLRMKSETNPGNIYPFGEAPNATDTFYIASEDAFSKAGTTIRITFGKVEGRTDRKDPTGERNLSWEYWNGSAWTKLQLKDDKTNELKEEGGEVTFLCPEDLEPTETSGHQGYWIRVRLVSGGYTGFTYTKDDKNETWSPTQTGEAPRFSNITITYEQQDEPDHVLRENNLERSGDLTEPELTSFSPFLPIPDRKQTLYLGFDRKLEDGPINVFFALIDKEFPEAFHPRVRWEYCSDPPRDEWTRLNARDETENLTKRGIVSLVFPEATRSFDRFGRELYWIRVRLLGNEFVPRARVPSLVITDIDAEGERVTIQNRGDRTVDLSGYQIDFEYDRPGTQLRSFPQGLILDAGESITIATGEKASGRADYTFDYKRWVLNNEEPDLVAITSPSGTVVTKSRDEPADITLPSASRRLGSENEDRSVSRDVSLCGCSTGDILASESLRPCNETVPSISRTGGPIATEEPPSLRGIHPNTGWGNNMRTITGETLGSSDGTRDQEFIFATPPVISESVWVDELSVLSEEQREELKESSDITVEEEHGPRDQITAFWVRWTRIENFLESRERSRHYTIDRSLGRLTFGDGVAGKIPPVGRDNIRGDYTTGGGAAGNIKTEEVTALVSSIPFIDGVTNPEPGDGGAEAESVTAVLSRAPQELKHRGRAVTSQDFERIALSATRRLARAKCIPGMDKNGERSAGWVTMVVIPRSGEDKPVPSPEVKGRVRDTLRDRGSAPLVDPKHGRLVVRGPAYVGVSVTANVAAERIGSLSALEERVMADLRRYLNPLTGGRANEGWDFGELPCLSDFYALLEGVEGVDYVESLSVIVEGDGRTVRVTEGEPMPTIPREALIFSGTHEIQATGGV